MQLEFILLKAKWKGAWWSELTLKGEIMVLLCNFLRYSIRWNELFIGVTLQLQDVGGDNVRLRYLRIDLNLLFVWHIDGKMGGWSGRQKRGMLAYYHLSMEKAVSPRWWSSFLSFVLFFLLLTQFPFTYCTRTGAVASSSAQRKGINGHRPRDSRRRTHPVCDGVAPVFRLFVCFVCFQSLQYNPCMMREIP